MPHSQADIKYIERTELLRAMDDPHTQIVDIRSPNAYNGWSLHGEPRGGHIPGARNMPSRWFGYLDWPEIMAAKRLRPEQPLVLVGDFPIQLQKIARRVLKAGFSDVAVFAHFSNKWLADEKLPLERLARWRHLVPPTWLHKKLERTRESERNPARVVLCHVHYRNPDDYAAGHIPGAIEVDTNWLESPETWNRRSPDEVGTRLKSLGIDCDTTVVCYGRFSAPKNDDPFPGSSAGHLGAFRAATIMLWAGVKDVRMLNGGLQSWLGEGFRTTDEPSAPEPVADFGAEIPGRPDLIVDTPQAKEILADPNANLVSVRSWREYIGEVSGYNYIEKKGRIPGSVFGNCGSDAYHMENYRNLDHTCREAGEIAAMLAEVGVTPDKRNAFYCGTGWRGSEAFFNAWLMGWEGAALYDGGWFEWSNDANNPTASGDPNKPRSLKGAS